MLKIIPSHGKGNIPSTHSRWSAQCRTLQDFRITLKKIEKSTYQRLLRTPIYLRTQKRYRYASVFYRKDLPSLSVYLFPKILRGSKTSWSKYIGSVGTENLVLNKCCLRKIILLYSVATANHLNMYLHICLIYGRGKQFSKLLK